MVNRRRSMQGAHDLGSQICQCSHKETKTNILSEEFVRTVCNDAIMLSFENHCRGIGYAK